MDSKKICFILCVNNQEYFEEALYYINRLNIPDGYSIDCISITDAHSMASGYNEAMRSTDAKYKIYMHQDVMIIDTDFLFHILDIFTDNEIGMIGIAGPRKMPANGIMWMGSDIGAWYSSGIYCPLTNFDCTDNTKYDHVEAVDGMLMATQYDLPWREDIFDGWDFYDASQSFEFRKKGYKIVVPLPDKPFVIHDDGFLNLRNYFKYRKIFIKEYMS